jgi:hypothetical protein
MLKSHIDVFLAAAEQFKCWIALREPNPLYVRWIGRSGYEPKCVDCKAKTADNNTHSFGGLVVDPNLCPDAFKRESLTRALETWQNKFLQGGIVPVTFKVIESGWGMGLVKHNGLFIFPDFDLMLICRSNDNGDFIPTGNHKQIELFYLIKPLINKGLHTDMIQHGTEFLFKGKGAREYELVYWFGPGCRLKIYPSSMPIVGH